ncbi:MAG: FAD-dependent oxidoreductase, partial [Cyanobacteria bacterium]|nr:FAD-dependent oxidoreductase [Cyanobacteriota bacterium]
MKERHISGEAIENWDVVVVGAGPAGALAAIELARKGIQVLLVEKRNFPRWKVCGCCLNAQAQAVLASVGQSELIEQQGGVALDQLLLGHKGKKCSIALPGGRALSRERFDQALVEAAIAAGAHFRSGTTALLGPVTAQARNVTLQEIGAKHLEQVSAKVVLIAAGLANRCIPASEAGELHIKHQSRLGAGCVIRDAATTYSAGVIHMAIAKQGYVGLVQREDGYLNIAAAFDRQALKTNNNSFGAAEATRAVLLSAGFAIPMGLEQADWQVTPALTRHSTVVGGERFLLLGDAAGYVEPFTGEGMAWALTSAAAVVPLVLTGIACWSESIERRWRRVLSKQIGRRQRICRAMALLLQQPLTT